MWVGGITIDGELDGLSKLSGVAFNQLSQILVLAMFSTNQFTFTIMFVALASSVLASDPPEATIHSSAEDRLAYMQSSGNSYSVTVGEKGVAKFQEQPILRFTNPVSGVIDGGLFVWRDELGGPVAVAQFFICPGTEKLWLHEFQSLSLEPMNFDFKGKSAWAPRSAGITFKSIDGAGEPATSAEVRLRQMKGIARRFSVKDDFEGAKADELRLLTTPMIRYSNDKVLDGAIFAFAHGTDPELLVIIEARIDPKLEAPSKAEWKVALAPMTSYAIAATLDGKDFWSVGWRKAPHATTAIFMDLVFPPTK